MRFHFALSIVVASQIYPQVEGSLQRILDENEYIQNPPNGLAYFHCDNAGGGCGCELFLLRNSNLQLNGGQTWHSAMPVGSTLCTGSNGNYVQMQDDGNLVTYAGTHPAPQDICWETLTDLGGQWRYNLYGSESCQLYISRETWKQDVGSSTGTNLDLVVNEGSSMQEGTSSFHNGKCEVRLWSNGVLRVKNNVGGQSWNSGVTHDQSPKILVMQHDGNAVVYAGSAKAVVWATNTAVGDVGKYGLYIDEECNLYILNVIWSNIRSELKRLDRLERGGRFVYNGYTMIQQEDGNLVVYDGSPYGYNPVWSAQASSNNPVYVNLQEDGNLVLYERNGKFIQPYWNQYIFNNDAYGGEYKITLDSGGWVGHKI